jgi:mycofactocin system glycosyltransferase
MLPEPPPAAPLLGWRLRADVDTRALAPDVLLGGTPLRLLRLSATGGEAARRLFEGEAADDDATARMARLLVEAGLAQPEVEPRASLDELTIVIPVRDRPHELGELLGDLEGIRVVVVDDASTDAAAVRRLAGAYDAVVDRQERPLGPAGARNRGAAIASTPLVCFLDSDVRVPAGALERLLGHFDDPRVAAVAPRMRGPEGSSLAERFEREASPLDQGPRPGLVRPGGRLSYVPSAALLVRRQLALGLFDEELAVGEDVDAVWRLAEAGWSIRYEPAVELSHAPRRSWRAWVVQRESYGGSAALLEARHGEAAAPLRGSVWALGGWAMLLAGRPLVGLGLLGGSVPELRGVLDGVVDDPWRRAAAISLERSWSAMPIVARQLLRSYAPLLALGALGSRRLRRTAWAIVLIAGLGRWVRTDAGLDPVRFVLLSSADDLCYSAGLWRGALGARRLGALLPRLSRRGARRSS